MISDAYTREYDERQRKKCFSAQIDNIAKTAMRFGCEMNIKLREMGGVTINIIMPNGEKLVQFRKLETALAWAQKWTTI